MNLYRCYNCATDGQPHIFAGTAHVCPKCGTDARPPDNAKPGEGETSIHRIVVIHYHAPVEKPERGKPRHVIACQAKGRLVATAVFACVNCPACKETATWKKAQAENADGIHIYGDFQIGIDLKTGRHDISEQPDLPPKGAA